MANRGSFVKGEKRPNQGKRGPNKETKALKEMILQALDEQKGGGVAYLKDQALMNPNAFLSLLGKVLPTTLAGDPNNPVRFERIEVVIVDPKA
jgi:hypothetical protein